VTKLIVVDGDLEEVTGEVVTPFGLVPYRQLTNYSITQLPEAKQSDPPSIAYAAKVLGAERVLLVLRDVGVRKLVAPADFVEFTNGRFTTFFSHIGTGYVQQVPPFCPELRSAALQAGAADGGTRVVLNELPQLSVRQWWAAQGIELISTQSQPEGTLCRELEMCVAVVAAPEGMDLDEWVTAVYNYLPSERSCNCDQTMSFARKSGRLAANWREWIME
jgi:purine nucleoside phosphorylase